MSQPHLLSARPDDPSWAVVTRPDENGLYWVRDGKRWFQVTQVDGLALAAHRMVDDWNRR